MADFEAKAERWDEALGGAQPWPANSLLPGVGSRWSRLRRGPPILTESPQKQCCGGLARGRRALVTSGGKAGGGAAASPPLGTHDLCTELGLPAPLLQTLRGAWGGWGPPPPSHWPRGAGRPQALASATWGRTSQILGATGPSSPSGSPAASPRLDCGVCPWRHRRHVWSGASAPAAALTVWTQGGSRGQLMGVRRAGQGGWQDPPDRTPRGRRTPPRSWAWFVVRPPAGLLSINPLFHPEMTVVSGGLLAGRGPDKGREHGEGARERGPAALSTGRREGGACRDPSGSRAVRPQSEASGLLVPQRDVGRSPSLSEGCSTGQQVPLAPGTQPRA